MARPRSGLRRGSARKIGLHRQEFADLRHLCLDQATGTACRRAACGCVCASDAKYKNQSTPMKYTAAAEFTRKSRVRSDTRTIAPGVITGPTTATSPQHAILYISPVPWIVSDRGHTEVALSPLSRSPLSEGYALRSTTLAELGHLGRQSLLTARAPTLPSAASRGAVSPPLPGAALSLLPTLLGDGGLRRRRRGAAAFGRPRAARSSWASATP